MFESIELAQWAETFRRLRLLKLREMSPPSPLLRIFRETYNDDYEL